MGPRERASLACCMFAPAVRGTVCALVAVLVLVGWPSPPPTAFGQGPGDGGRGYRRLAPGVVTEIPAHKSLDESVQRLNLSDIAGVKLRQWQPADTPEMTTLRGLTNGGYPTSHAVWCLDFAFLPPRLIDVQVPDLSPREPRADEPAELRTRASRLWYLVYRVRNVAGARVRIEGREEGAADTPVEVVEKPVVFMPLFIFETREPLDPAEGLAAYRSYADQVVPGAAEAIRKREGPGPKLFDSVSIAEEPLAVGEERWGVATWEGVDPRIDFFTILVRGLTNRLEYRERVRAKLPQTALECLQLDFRRRGDAEDLDDQEVMVGYQGLFERVALGTALVDAANRVRNTRARPTEALEMLKLTWQDLLSPDRDETRSLEPGPQPERGLLAKVLDRIADLPSLEERERAARDLFGDGGPAMLGALADVLVRADARRSGAEQPGGASDSDALRSLATSIAELDRIEQDQGRLDEESRRFGVATTRLRMLENAVLAARTVAVLDELGVVLKPFSALEPREAFVQISQILEKEPNQLDKPIDKATILRGLFGPEGTAIYRDAIRFHQGIDHRWVFRYEN